MQPQSNSYSDIFAGLPASSPLFPSELIGGDYEQYSSVPEQEALQLLNQTSSFAASPSIAVSLEPLASPYNPEAGLAATSSKSSRKRSRKVSEDQNSGSEELSSRKTTAVSLSREKLLRITSAEYETYMKDVQRRRSNLTQDEIKDLRWMRRLVKNRESAQVSRDRKKNRLGELTAICNDLRAEQKGYTDTLTALEITNKALKEELNNLVSIVRQSPALAALWNNMHLLRKRTTAKVADEKSLFNNPAAAAMCLLAAMHTYNQSLSARATAAAAAATQTSEVEAAPMARTKCMDTVAADDLRSEMQFVVDQQTPMMNGEQPVLLMLLPQSAAAHVLRNQAVAQNALVLDLAGARPVEVQA